MSVQTLQALAKSYSPGYPIDLIALARRDEQRRENEILEIAAVAADVSADSLINFGLEPQANPSLLRAFKLQYPNVDLHSLVGASRVRLDGLAQGVKGKLFEVLVEERLNRGEYLGELALGPEQMARLADNPTQPEWDLEIVNSDGSVAEAIQLKATKSMSYIKRALDRYPDIRIATPSDIDGTAEEILQTNIPHEGLLETTIGQLEELSEDALTDLMDQTAEWALDAIPVFPALVVAVIEGKAIIMGRSSLKEGIHRGAKRLGASAVFTTLGATLTALDVGIVSVPTTVAGRVAWARLVNRIDMSDNLKLRTEALRLLATT